MRRRAKAGASLSLKLAIFDSHILARAICRTFRSVPACRAPAATRRHRARASRSVPRRRADVVPKRVRSKPVSPRNQPRSISNRLACILVLFSTVSVFRSHQPNDAKNPFAYATSTTTARLALCGVYWDLNFFRNAAKVEQARADLERLRAQQRGATSDCNWRFASVRRSRQARDTIKATDDGRKAGRGLLVLTVSNFDPGIGEAEELFKDWARTPKRAPTTSVPYTTSTSPSALSARPLG